MGAHHQNGRAERAIQTVVWKARSMMIHQHITCPSEYDARQWPLAMSHTAFIYNHTPRQDNGFTPMEMFTGGPLSHTAFIYNHTPRQDNGFTPMEMFTGARMNCNYLRPGSNATERAQDSKMATKGKTWTISGLLQQTLFYSGPHLESQNRKYLPTVSCRG